MSIIRLIDANALREEFKGRCICECDSCKYQKHAYCALIDLAPTVNAYTFEDVTDIRNEALNFAKNSYSVSDPQKEHAINAYTGAKPKFHKGKYGKQYDSYTCGHCGHQVKDINDNYCWNCGYRILWDSIRCLTDKTPETESEQMTFDDLLKEDPEA